MTKLHLKFKVGRGAEKKLGEIGKVITDRMKLYLDGWTKSTWLANSIQYRVEMDKKRVVIFTTNPVALFFEKGTKPHMIPVGKKGFLAFKAGHSAGSVKFGNYVYTKKPIKHPGTEVKPFFSPGFLNSKPDIQAILNKK